MPLRALHRADRLVYQCSGPEDGVPVVYLPGVHGCWTPLERARERFGDGIRLIEIAYPLFDHWSLEHYAGALEHLLDTLDIDSAHLVGESFGSLVGWQLGLTHPGRTRSHILVGGFCHAPRLRVAATAGLGLALVWSPAFDTIVDTYVSWKDRRGERRGAAHGIKAYPAVRGVRGQRATANRMRLIQASDFRRRLGDVRFPVRYIGGAADRVVPVAREIGTLERELPERSAFASELLPRAPHAIIASHPHETVATIARWVGEIETARTSRHPRDAVLIDVKANAAPACDDVPVEPEST